MKKINYEQLTSYSELISLLIFIISSMIVFFYFIFKPYLIYLDKRIADGKLLYSKQGSIIEVMRNDVSQLYPRNKYNNVMVIEMKNGDIIVQFDSIKPQKKINRK